MKAKIKVLSYYFNMLFIALLVLLLSLVTLVKFTVFDEEYLLKHLENNDYYDELYKSIKEEMSYYIIQSGLDEEVLEDIYTKEMITEEAKSIINNFYKGKELTINTEKVADNLNSNIEKYLLKNNIMVDDQKALDRFVDEMIIIYDKEIRLSDKINTIQSKFNKLDNIIDNLFVVLFISILVIGIISHIFYKRIIYTIPCISSAILLLLGNYLLYNRIDVGNILFWNDNVSTIIKSILFDINRFVKEEASVLIILGIITFIIEYIITNKGIITKKDPIMKNRIKKQSTDKEKDKYNKLILDKQTTTKKSLFSFLKKDKEIVEEKKDDNVIDELFGYTYNTIVTDNSTDTDTNNDQNSSNTPTPTNKNTSPKSKKKKKKKR